MKSEYLFCEPEPRDFTYSCQKGKFRPDHQLANTYRPFTVHGPLCQDLEMEYSEHDGKAPSSMKTHSTESIIDPYIQGPLFCAYCTVGKRMIFSMNSAGSTGCPEKNEILIPAVYHTQTSISNRLQI